MNQQTFWRRHSW